MSWPVAAPSSFILHNQDPIHNTKAILAFLLFHKCSNLKSHVDSIVCIFSQENKSTLNSRKLTCPGCLSNPACAIVANTLWELKAYLSNEWIGGIHHGRVVKHMLPPKSWIQNFTVTWEKSILWSIFQVQQERLWISFFSSQEKGEVSLQFLFHLLLLFLPPHCLSTRLSSMSRHCPPTKYICPWPYLLLEMRRTPGSEDTVLLHHLGAVVSALVWVKWQLVLEEHHPLRVL